MDEAFHFYYLDNLTRLEEAGAELVMFSPLHDSRPPRVNGLYFGGGYPEVYAAQLGANASMRCEVAAYVAVGGVIYAECGGLMYLCAELRTLDGGAYPMCGVVPARTVMCDRLQALGYVEVQTRRPSIIGGAGTRFRGHQFRYSRLEPLSSAIDPAFRIVRRYGGDEIDEASRSTTRSHRTCTRIGRRTRPLRRRWSNPAPAALDEGRSPSLHNHFRFSSERRHD